MKKNKIIKWKVKKSILKTGDYKLNNHIASKISKKGFKKIIKHYTDITPQNIKKILKKKKFAGVGIDNTGSFKMKKKIYYNSKTNFILTDHQAGVSTNLSRRKELIYNNINNYYYGKKLRYEK
tara:strand:- start:684 stop:1052 length:369 start_codon:yes stop_codon:yes gene_type:complete